MYELVRKTLIIVLCLTLSKILHMNVSVYIVLFSVVISTTCYSNNILEIIKRLLPSLCAALCAVLINQFFAFHPFIIWTCTIFYFDHIRRHADNNIKARQAILPLFMIIFINTYANSTGYTLLIPAIARDLISSMLITSLIASFINHLMPIKISIPPSKIVPLAVTELDRLKMLLLVGGGLAFIMINEVTSAVFCLVPLISATMQPSHSMMKTHSGDKMLSQIGGCCIALLASMLFAGTEINILSYFFVSFTLVFTLLLWCDHKDMQVRSIHSDALMGFLIPYQLYVAKLGNNFGINSIFLRAFELAIALLIIYTIAYWLEYHSLKAISKR